MDSIFINVQVVSLENTIELNKYSVVVTSNNVLKLNANKKIIQLLF